MLVDAENMSSGLGAVDPHAADVFANHPEAWLGWLAGLTYPGVEAWGPFHRQVLHRTCFLNTDTGRTLRRRFAHAGFTIVDCPSLTGAGKNAADIHLVIAMLDLLDHPTRCDEVILLSSDADFTPALARLRTHDRRTVVVASGPHCLALEAACDHLIPAEVFARALSTLVSPAESVATPAPVVLDGAGRSVTSTVTKKTAPAGKAPAKKVSASAATKKSTAKTVVKKSTVKEVATRASVKGAPVPSSSPIAADPGGDGDVVAARERARQVVGQLVAEHDSPVPLAAVAPPVRAALGSYAKGWAGAGGLKKLLLSLDMPDLAVTGTVPGYLYDTGRHAPPAAT